MSKKKNNQRKPSSPSAESGEYDDLPETISSSVLQDLLKAQECMFKSVHGIGCVQFNLAY